MLVGEKEGKGLSCLNATHSLIQAKVNMISLSLVFFRFHELVYNSFLYF